MLVRAIISFLILSGVFGFFIPISFAGFTRINHVQWAGVPVVLSGLLLLLWCVRDFYVFGKGTLAPWDPPRKIVVVGLYRYIRNPMYACVLILVLGWGILFQSVVLWVYTGILFLAFHIRIRIYEEPWLQKTFGEEWQSYRSKVPRWLPHILKRNKMVCSWLI
jgi:protein-S-isoprenylcysteine O-methyltransferase Ste14